MTNKYINENLLVKKINLKNNDIKIYLDKSTNRIILVNYELKQVYFMNKKIKPNINLSDYIQSSYIDEVKTFSSSMIDKWFKNTRYEVINRYGDEIYGETDRKFDYIANGTTENVKDLIDLEYKEFLKNTKNDLDQIKNYRLGTADPIADINTRISTSLNAYETEDQNNTNEIKNKIGNDGDSTTGTTLHSKMNKTNNFITTSVGDSKDLNPPKNTSYGNLNAGINDIKNKLGLKTDTKPPKDTLYGEINSNTTNIRNRVNNAPR